MLNSGIITHQYIMPLDLLAATPAAVAYSAARKLRFAYAGYSLRVARSSDSAELDIGFVNGFLDISSMLTFLGGYNGSIVTLYDQSGNAVNLTQTTANRRPLIVNAGVLNVENLKPFFRFYGNPGFSSYALNLPATRATNGTISAVMKFPVNGTILGYDAYSPYTSTPTSSLVANTASASVQNGSGFFNTTKYNTVVGTLPWPSSLAAVSISPQTANSGTEWLFLGKDSSYGQHLNAGGGYSEVIVFNTKLSDNDNLKLIINQKKFYNIS